MISSETVTGNADVAFSDGKSPKKYFEKAFDLNGAKFSRRRAVSESSQADFEAWCDKLNIRLLRTVGCTLKGALDV